jgi:hypothetical protein
MQTELTLGIAHNSSLHCKLLSLTGKVNTPASVFENTLTAIKRQGEAESPGLITVLILED